MSTVNPPLSRGELIKRWRFAGRQREIAEGQREMYRQALVEHFDYDPDNPDDDMED